MYLSVANNVTALIHVKICLYPFIFLFISVYMLYRRCTAININAFIIFSFLSHPPTVIPYEITVIFTNVNGFESTVHFSKISIEYLVFEICNIITFSCLKLCNVLLLIILHYHLIFQKNKWVLNDVSL